MCKGLIIYLHGVAMLNGLDNGPYKPMNFVLTTVVLFTVVALINETILPGSLANNRGPVTQLTFADSVYFTYSLMTAVGFSSIMPITALGKLAAVAEKLCAIGWLGVFTSLLVKRFLS